MTRRFILGAFGAMRVFGQTAGLTRRVIERLYREAEAFAQLAPHVVGSEELEQVQPRTATAKRPAVRRRVLSNYGFLDTPEGLKEVRQVLSVDGKPAKKDSKGLDMLAAGVTSLTDKDKRKLLENFERNGLRGVATDFGQLILLFFPGRNESFEISYRRTDPSGTPPMLVMAYQQLDGGELLTIYEQGKALKQRLVGEIWVRADDSQPARITMRSTREDRGELLADEAEVNYSMSEFGCLLPVSITHTFSVNGEVEVVDEFRYKDFRQVSKPAGAN